MAIAPGTQVGSYQVIALIGVGGMGEVYRARDTKLRRDVALKVLPQLFAADPDRGARFAREAHLLATLNHPNIASIYGIEEGGPTTALVLELVDGETLADRIRAGALPADEALRIARQIVDALDAAHEKGIVHRDLKPGNVKLTGDGLVKVLDFGLGKALAAHPLDGAPLSPDNSPTLTSPAFTNAGAILGTAAYMAPEQVRGKVVDKRADIWAFGCVLYEMLTGTRPFDGETMSDTLAAVLKNEPDWTRLPAALPSSISQLLHSCLARDPKARLRDVADARLLMESVIPASTIASSKKRGRRWLGVVAGATAAALVVGAFWFASHEKTPSVPQPLRHVTVQLPASLAGSTSGGGPALTMAPDGSAVAFIARSGTVNQLFVHRLVDGTTTMLPGPGNPGSPVFSPDGRSLAFVAAGTVWRVALDGGKPELLCTGPPNPMIGFRGGTWSADGRLVFAGDGLLELRQTGKSCEKIVALDADREARFLSPQILPGGRGILVTVSGISDDADSASIVVIPTGTTERRVIVRGARAGHVTPSGHLLFARGDQILAAPFDLDRLATTADPVVIVDGVSSGQFSLPLLGLSNLGDLVYASGHDAGNRLVWVSRDGARADAGAPPRSYQPEPRLSPDGRYVTVSIGTGDHFLWLFALNTGTLSPLAADRDVHAALWSPDGHQVAYPINGRGIAIKSLESTGEPEVIPIADASRVTLATQAWSPDAATIVISHASATKGFDLFALNLHDKTMRTLLSSPSNVFGAQFSPDGHWLAYASTESGRLEVYVTDFPAAQVKKPVSTDGGAAPVWSRDGRELFYVSGTAMMAAPVRNGASIVFGRPVKLFDGIEFATAATPFAVAADGRFLFVEDGQGDSARHNQLTLVTNWLEDLNRRTRGR